MTTPLPPKSQRPRVAVPMAPPVLTPSLIPYDVLQAYETEQAHLDTTGPIHRPPTLRAESRSAEVQFIAESKADAALVRETFAQVPELAKVSPQTLAALCADARKLEVPDGEALFLEGDPADSFAVVVSGTFEIIRKREGREVALRHIGAGEAIGLFGLFAGASRGADARAIGDVVALEIPALTLQKLVNADPALNERMVRFYRERTLERFLGSSKLFSEVDSIARARLIGRFREQHCQNGEVLVQPGEVTNLVAVVMHGSLVLEDRTRLGQDAHQREVLPGQFLAVTSALSGLPAKPKVSAGPETSLAVLGQKELVELLRDYPPLRRLNARLAQYAVSLDRDVFCGDTGTAGV